MRTFDFEAFVYDGEVYCTECLPHGIDPEGEEVHPVFALRVGLLPVLRRMRHGP